MSEISKKARATSQLAAFSAQVMGYALLLLAASCGESPTPTNSGGAAGSASGGSVGAAGTQAASASAGANNDAGAAGVATAGSSADAGAGGTAFAGAGAGGAATAGSNNGDAGSGGAIAACNIAHAKGVTQMRLMSGDTMRKVRLFVPSAYDGKTRLPLLLNLHGSSDTADNFAKSSQMEQVAESEGFVVAGLEAVAGQWNVPPADNLPDDVLYASDAIAQVVSALCIDDARVYASGFSGGGRMSSQLGCKLPDQITGIGPVAGVRFPAPCPGRALPVIAIHGLADTTNAYAGEGPTHPRWNESVETAVLGWATKNACNLTRQTDDPPGPVSVYSYGQCQGDANVKLLRMDGVEHAYPTGTPLYAAQEVWSFLKAYSRN